MHYFTCPCNYLQIQEYLKSVLRLYVKLIKLYLVPRDVMAVVISSIRPRNLI